MKKVKLIILSILSIFLLNSCSVLYMAAATGCMDNMEFLCPIAYPKEKKPNKSPYKIYDIQGEERKKYLTEVSNRKKIEIKYRNEIIKVPNNFELLEINLKYFDRDGFEFISKNIKYLGGEIEETKYFYDSEKKIGMPIYIFESKYKDEEELLKKVFQSDKNMLKKENEKVKFCYRILKNEEFMCNRLFVKNIGENIFIYYNMEILGEDFIGEVIK